MISISLPVAILIILNLLHFQSFSQEWQPINQLVGVPGEDCENPKVAVSGNHVYVIWEDNRDAGFTQVYLRRSDNHGEGFHPGIRLSDDDNIKASYSKVVCWEDQVHVVWMGEDATSDKQVYYCQSKDGGESFSAPVQMTSATSESFTPAIAVFENNIHIVWVDLKDFPSAIRVYYIRSIDGGATWSPETPLGMMATEGYFPKIKADGTNIFTTWINMFAPPATPDIVLIKSIDNGDNWGPVTSMYNTNTLIVLPNYSFDAREGHLHLAWEDFRNGTSYQVYYGRSPDDGNSLDPESCLNSGNDEYKHPEIAAFGELVQSCWYNKNDQIEYRRGFNMGQEWEATVIISEMAAKAQNPDIGAFEDNAYVVWEQENASSDKEIYFRRTASDFSVDEFSGSDQAIPHLHQNHPNPFSTTTSIGFHLPEKTEASIRIYNSTGILIKEIGDRVYGSGEHTMKWDASGIPKGIYFYQLHIRTAQEKLPEIQKMILY